jgi:hypothetical protein
MYTFFLMTLVSINIPTISFYSPPTSAKVKKMWIYTSTPPYAFMAYCLIS